MSQETHENKELLTFVYEMIIASQGDISAALKVLQGYIMSYASGTFPMTAHELELTSKAIKQFETLAKVQ